MTESYIVTIGSAGGQRTAERRPLHVPVELATGQLERLSDLAIREAIKDLTAEEARRQEQAARRADIQTKTGGWSPFDAIRGAA